MNADRKKNINIGLSLFGICMLFSLWGATQSLAKSVEYNYLLGSPIFSIGETPYYMPFMYFVWYFEFGDVIPNLFNIASDWLFFGFMVSMFVFVMVAKRKNVMDSHGSAAWATKEDIINSGLNSSSGVILGRNPYAKKDKKLQEFLKHDGPEHIICMAPTRSGKGVGVIIPTLLEWPNSVFVLDVKGENWGLTAGYRQKHLGNKVLKFDPTCKDASTAKYNPLNEIRIKTSDEMRDVQNICDMLVDPMGDAKPDHWSRTSHALLVSAIIHLKYLHMRENINPPSLTNVLTFLSCPGGDITNELLNMQSYSHISFEEFISDDNVFEKLYGTYTKLHKDILSICKGDQKEYEIYLKKIKTALKEVWPKDKNGKFIENITEVIKNFDKNNLLIKIDENIFSDDTDSTGEENWKKSLSGILSHPKVAEGSSQIVNKPDDERGSVISTAISFLGLYQDPTVAMNTSSSDFYVEDLMRDNEPVSLYLVIPPGDLSRSTPLVRMLINILLSKLTAEMKFKDGVQVKRLQKCLLLLDEFPVFGCMNSMEKGLAYIAGYGLKALIIVQSINQLNKAYSKDNSIVDNCHVRLFFTPNDENTPVSISKMLGKKTIKVKSNSGKVGEILNQSENISEFGRELLTPDEVSKIPKNNSILFVTGNKPIYANKIFFYDEEYFTSKTKINAPKFSDKINEKVR